MLRRLSHTEAFLDLSRGGVRPLDLGKLGAAVSRHIARRYAGDAARAEREGARRVRSTLRIGGLRSWSEEERRSLARLAPIVELIPHLERWPAAERRALGRVIRAKGAGSELAFARAAAGHSRLAAALEVVARL